MRKYSVPNYGIHLRSTKCGKLNELSKFLIVFTFSIIVFVIHHFQTLLPVILGHTPAGSAINQLLHYGQEVDSGKFRKFDYGRVENLIRYKHTSPPDYDLNNIRTPVALYYSQDDWLATVKDTEHLLKTLPNVVESYLVPHKKFNHVDFGKLTLFKKIYNFFLYLPNYYHFRYLSFSVWGCDAPALLYSQILKTMDLAGRNEYAYENDVRK